MGALATSGYPVPLAAAHALAAGADVLLFNCDMATLQEAQGMILRWLDEGRIIPARLDEAVLRLLTTKQRFELM
jgi:beta-glucosidase-like glycosyl hydrolase